jgi:hypothetical protein
MPSLSFFHRVVEEKIREAQKTGAFDNLLGKGKPLDLEDLSAVPEELRMAYHLLKNAGLLPPELELRREIVTLWELLRLTGEEQQRRAILKDIEQKMIRIDLLKRRSFSLRDAESYGKKLTRKFTDLYQQRG